MSLFNNPIAILRPQGALVDGVWVELSTEEFQISGTVQPVEGEELQFLPENRRETGTIKIFTSSDLNVSAEGMDISSDYVIWEDKRWEIVSKRAYGNGLIPHYKYYAQSKPGVYNG